MKKIVLVPLFVALLVLFTVGFAYAQESPPPTDLSTGEAGILASQGEEPKQTPKEESVPIPSVDTPEKINRQDAKTKSKKEKDALTAQSTQAISDKPLPDKEPPKNDPWLNLKGFQNLFVSNLFSGEARLDIPIPVPPGRRGLTPELTLSYSSFKRDYISPYGYGFDLSISSIFRNTAHGLDQLYTRNDFAVKFAGKYSELVLVDAASNLYMGKDGNDFNKYFFESNQWRVQDTAGILFYFGTDSSARQSDPQDTNRVYQWMLKKIVDTNSNAVEYAYLQDRNQVYLDSIRYVFTSPTESVFRIKFNYLSKSRSATSYHPGFPVSSYLHLQSIDEQENLSSTWVTKKRYVFAYDDINNPVSRLISIAQEAGSQTLPPIQFEYYTDGTAIGLLKTASNSNGGEINLEYLASTVYRDGTGKQNFLPFIIKTLSKLTHTDLVKGISSVKTFSYHGGHYFYDPGEVFTREYVGFHEVISVDSAGTTTKTYFHQSQFATDNAQSRTVGEFDDHISKKGRIYREEIYDSAGNLFLSTITKWGKVGLGNDRFFVSLDRISKLSWDGDSSHRDTAEEFLYDQYGNITKNIKWGEVTGNVSTGEFTDLYTDKITTQISYALNAANNILTFPSSQTVYGQDGVTKVQETKFYYDALAIGQITKGNLTLQERWVNGATYINTQQTYNSYGLVTQIQDPRGNKTTYAYDSFNLYPISATNAKNQITTFTYDYSLGKIKTTKDPNNRVFETVYDPFGRVKEEKAPDLASPSLLVTKTTIIYTDTVTPRKTQTTHYPDGTNSYDVFTYFDGFGRKIQERKEAEVTNTFSVKDFAYNEIGLPAKESLPYFATGYAYTSPTTNSNLYTNYTYDAQDRVKNIINALGITTNTYDDWKTTVMDAESNKKDFIKDAYGRLIKVNEYNGASTYATVYEYSVLDNLTKIIDSKGNIRNFTYDALARRLTAQDLHSPSDATFGIWTYTYDNTGNITKTVDPKSQIIDQTYDVINRVLTENYTGTAGTEITYNYDTGVNGIGRLTSAVTSPATTNYLYNALGSIDTETRTISNINYVTKFEYDRQGNITVITYPDNAQVKYTYNSAGLLEKVSRKESGDAVFADVVSNIDYSPFGKIAFKNFTNGVKTTYTYDSNKLYRLTNITTAGASNLQNISYTYDKIGNITKILDSSSTNAAKTATYAYDDLYRLTSATVTGAANGQNYTQNYSYDSIGNITNKSDIGNYLYQGNSGTSYANSHAVTSVNGVISSYDNNGNLTADSSRTNTWDYRNRISKIRKSNKTYTYTYDHNNNRISVDDSGGTRIYPNRLYNILGTSKTKHIFAGDEMLATIEKSGTSPVVAYYDHTDHLGGSSVLTNAAGAKQQLLDYYPFGGIRLNEKVSTFDEQRKFTGQEFDTTTNLHYFIQRYYNQDIGRFISQDSVFLRADQQSREFKQALANPQLLNSYSYVANNPLKYVDEDGEFAQIIVGAIVGLSINLIGQGLEDILAGDLSGYEAYVGAAASGAVLGAYTVATGGIALLTPLLGHESGYIRSGIEQSLKILGGRQEGFESSQFEDRAFWGGTNNIIGEIVPKLNISGITKGIGNFSGVEKGIYTGLQNRTISVMGIQASTIGKIAIANLAQKGPGELAQADLSAISRQITEIKAILSRIANSINNLIQENTK